MIIRKILRFFSGYKEICESESKGILAGYLMPHKLHDYEGVGQLLVDEMVINSWIDILRSLQDDSYRERAIELIEFISKRNPETPEIPQLRRFRMSVGEAKYYLHDAKNLPMQSLLIEAT